MSEVLKPSVQTEQNQDILRRKQESNRGCAEILEKLEEHYKDSFYNYVPETTRKEWIDAIRQQAQNILNGSAS